MRLGWLRRFIELPRRDVLKVAYRYYTVAHLQPQARGGQEVDASTVDAGRVELVSVVEAQRAKRHAVVFALGNEDSARVDRCGCGFPVHFYLVAENRAEAVDVVCREYDEEFVAYVDLCS